RQDLQSHYDTIAKLQLRQLFKEDPGRGERMTAEAEGIFLDYSKNRITRETLDLLLQLVAECGLQSRIDAMFRGEKINVTEDRSVLHVALRAPKGKRIVVDGKDVVSDIHAVLEKMADFAGHVRSGTWSGQTGKRLLEVVNIGIGGCAPGAGMRTETAR